MAAVSAAADSAASGCSHKWKSSLEALKGLIELMKRTVDQTALRVHSACDVCVCVCVCVQSSAW